MHVAGALRSAGGAETPGAEARKAPTRNPQYPRCKSRQCPRTRLSVSSHRPSRVARAPTVEVGSVESICVKGRSVYRTATRSDESVLRVNAISSFVTGEPGICNDGALRTNSKPRPFIADVSRSRSFDLPADTCMDGTEASPSSMALKARGGGQ